MVPGFYLHRQWSFGSHLNSNGFSQYSHISPPFHQPAHNTSPLKSKQPSIESAKASTLSVIPEETERLLGDCTKDFPYFFGDIQNANSSHDITEEMKMNINKNKPDASLYVIDKAELPIAEDTFSNVAGLPHFSFLFENLEKIEGIIVDSGNARLEREILLHIERLGALKLFHAFLSRTLKDPKILDVTGTCPEHAMVQPMDEQADGYIVSSGKKVERKAQRERALKKVTDEPIVCSSLKRVKKSTKSINAALTHKGHPGNSKSRSHLRAQSEVEMSRGVQEVAKLEKIRANLEENLGRDASFSVWAEAAGINEKVLKQQLHFGWFCRDKLLRSTRPLVMYLAKSYRGRGIGFEDLLQAGSLGVLQGAERFDHTRGYRFSTYVQYWIRKSLSALVARHSRGVQIPMALNKVLNQTVKAKRALHQMHGRHPREVEIAEFTGLSLVNVRLANKCLRVHGSIDQRIGDNWGATYMEVTADTFIETPEKMVMKQHMREAIHEVLVNLHPREKQVLMLRYGLWDGRCKSLEEIGRLYNVTKEWIRKIEKMALEKVRKEEVQCNLNFFLNS
ncbi:RNA polymerase sigma factor sigC [Amborella trichopoda]|uniref:RNA polymerase sigma factor sigC n=1 Tax=Amborella trichopoda TaxID=13333 RepID=UPI0005D37A50|nr:RNA polymerase sigma factor sigC [Amborella trichopoda]|eukprot:XP_006853783.2 RNA polymerase sigma factor sigC [Amborella trichopoda]